MVDFRALSVKAKARKFAKRVKETHGFALIVPNEIIDWLRDDEVETFKQCLRNFGLVQRADFKWEQA